MSVPSIENVNENTEEDNPTDTAQGSKNEDIVEKKGPRNSVVWKYFGYLKSDKKQSSVHCKLCRKHVPTKTGNTTNLFYHLKQCHPLEHAQCKTLQSQPQTSAGGPPKTTSVIPEQQQQTIVSAFSSSMPYDKKTKRHRDITNAIAYCIAKYMMPVSTVENEGFKRLIKVIDPRYQLPGRKHFSQTALPQLYTECRETVEKELQSVSYFATTSDMWSSRTSEPYMSLTAHFIDQDWNLKSKCLQTAYFPEDHTGEVIALGLTEALASWGLSEDKQACITTDSGTNIVKATSLNNWTRLQCFGHRLHSAVDNKGFVHTSAKSRSGLSLSKTTTMTTKAFNMKDEVLCCFRDVKPGAEHHYLVVPRMHIDSCKSLKKEDVSLVKKMVEMGKAVLLKQHFTDLKDIRLGFHVPPYYTVPHLHLHVLAPASQMVDRSLRTYGPRAFWFITADKLIQRLDSKENKPGKLWF